MISYVDKLRDANEEDDFGNAEIHKTVLQGRISEVKKFKKDEFSIQNSKGETPLHLACQSDRVLFDIVEYICKEYKALITSMDCRRNTPLHLACASKNFEKVKTLCKFEPNLEARNDDDETPLLVACKVGACEIVIYLLQKGASPQAQNKNGETIQRIAKNLGNENMLEAIKIRKKDGNYKNFFRTIIGWENEELTVLKNKLNECESIIKELENNRAAHWEKISQLRNERDSLKSKIICLKMELDRLEVEGQNKTYEVLIPCVSHFNVEERSILLEHLTSVLNICRSHVEFGSADETGCSSKLQESVLADESDTVKTILNGIKEEIQKGLSWKRASLRVNYQESAIIPSGLSSRSFLTFVTNDKLIIKFLNLVVSIYQADITQEDVDAVLASTDKNLKSFVGVAEAVAQKAGRTRVTELCMSTMRERRYQPLGVGEVIHINGGRNLKARYIMYTVGPENDARANTPDVCFRLLLETFANALHYADQILRVKSAAVPAISAGDEFYSNDKYLYTHRLTSCMI